MLFPAHWEEGMIIQSNQMIVEVGMSASAQRERLGADLIDQTINKMNENQRGSMKSDFQFQKDVLSAAAADLGGMTSQKGTIINLIV